MKRKSVKRLLAMTFVMALLTGTLAGCQKEEANPASDSEGGTSGQTLSMMVPTTWNTDALAKGISMYEEETGNKVEIETVPDDQIADLIKTRLATDTDVPDILAQNNIFVYEQIKEYFVPHDGEWIEKLNPEHREKIYTMSQDGEIYMAPYGSATALGLIYNKQIMEENGIEVPIMSYSELLDACETLKSNGVTPMSISNKENWTAQILCIDQLWSGFTSDDFTKLKTGQLNYKDVPSLQKLFGNMLALKEKGYINEDYMSTTMDMSLEDVATGECAMTPAGDWSYSVMTTNFPDAVDNIGMIPVPISDDAIALNIGASSKYMWVTQSGNSELAKEFVNFMISDETIQEMYAVEPGICPIQGVDVEQNSWDAEMTGYSETIPYAKQYGELNGFNPGDYAGTVQQLFSGKTVEEALQYWYDDCVQVNIAAGTEGF